MGQLGIVALSIIMQYKGLIGCKQSSHAGTILAELKAELAAGGPPGGVQEKATAGGEQLQV